MAPYFECDPRNGWNRQLSAGEAVDLEMMGSKTLVVEIIDNDYALAIGPEARTFFVGLCSKDHKESSLKKRIGLSQVCQESVAVDWRGHSRHVEWRTPGGQLPKPKRSERLR